MEPLTEEQVLEYGSLEIDNINDIQHAESFVKLIEEENEVIKYYCPAKFSKVKYIILSATLNEKIYRKYFAGILPVIFYEYKRAPYMGKVIQYTYNSLGRRDLSKKM